MWKMSKQSLPSIEEMIEGRACRFALTVAVSKRAREIISDYSINGRPLEENAVNAAFRDFKNQNFDIVNE
jgi:DNA-directed RNA polymerase subunit K/omega